jgi:DNA phosphorothioation-associated DGQHR protein 1
MSDEFPIEIPALKINQPLGVFYVTKLEARLLLQVTFSDPLRVISESNSTYQLTGSQREESLKKKKEIAGFIETVEAAFPNSIILGANYKESGELEEDEKNRWTVKDQGHGGCFSLVIPSSAKLASIIDGQHRLHSFEYVSPEKRSMELLCAIYLDLPNPFQAYLFATINFNQKKVDRSLAYELYGFDLEGEPPHSWSPEKTAVFLTRKLNTQSDSPLYRRIIIAAQNDEILFRDKPEEVDWAVSTATVVDGILRLFSSNPKRDKDIMHKEPISKRNRRMLKDIDDRAPLRELYLETNDLAIYTAVKNFFLAVNQIFWSHASERSYIKRTVGIQALFDILRLLLKDFRENKKISVEFFNKYLVSASNIDFSNTFFQASGIGKSRIRNIIELKIGLIDSAAIPPNDLEEYLRIAN